MKPIQTIVTMEFIEDLASRSNLRYGRQMLERGEVVIEQPNVFNLLARVSYSGHQVRTVEFHQTPKGLRWKCTCTNRKNFFCNHCVAVGLKIAQNREDA